MGLASEISGHSFGEDDAGMSETDFLLLVETIFEKINLLDKWSKSKEDVEEEDDEAEDGEEGEGDSEGGGEEDSEGDGEGDGEGDTEEDNEEDRYDDNGLEIDGDQEDLEEGNEDQMLNFYYG